MKNKWAYQRYQWFLISIIGLFMDYVAVIIKALEASCAQEFCTKRDDEGEISTVKIARS